MNTTQGLGPCQQLRVAAVCDREVILAETATKAVNHDGDVFVLVGVDTDDDIGALECDAGHGYWPPLRVNGPARRSGGQDKTVMGPVEIRLL